MKFSQIPGLSELKEQLVAMVEKNHVPHALLFSGKVGSPNLAMALAFSSYLNCENRLEGDACGQCSSCNKAIKYIHPDIHYVLPLSSTSSIATKDLRSVLFYKEWRSFISENPFGTIEEWTEAFGGGDKQAFINVNETRDIIKNMSMKAFEGQYKIVIVWLPELMQGAGANSLLKFLEEPPDKTQIFMVTNNEDQLLSTITSRTQRIGVRKFTDSEIRNYLTKSLQVESNRISPITHLADGDIRLAENLSVEIEDDTHGWVRDWMRLCFTHKFIELTQRSEEFHAMNKLIRKSVLQYAMGMMRESLVVEADQSLTRVDGEELKFVTNFSNVLSVEKISDIYEQINNSIYYLERNGSAKMVFLNLSIKIAAILNKK